MDPNLWDPLCEIVEGMTLKESQKGITKIKNQKAEVKDVRGAFDGTTDRSVWVRLLGWLLAPFRAAAEI